MILDVTCGKRMMWFNKNHFDTIYFDKRKIVKPDVVGDFRHLPFKDDSFELIVFDPPHGPFGPLSNMRRDFGSLKGDDIIPTLYYASRELFRCLQDKGFLIFKWNSLCRSLNRVLQAFPEKPLFGQKTASGQALSHTYWVIFQKVGDNNS